MLIHIVLILSSLQLLLTANTSISDNLRKKKAFLVKKHLKRLKKIEGAIKLVGGRAEFEGKKLKDKCDILGPFNNKCNP